MPCVYPNIIQVLFLWYTYIYILYIYILYVYYIYILYYFIIYISIHIHTYMRLPSYHTGPLSMVQTHRYTTLCWTDIYIYIYIYIHTYIHTYIYIYIISSPLRTYIDNCWLNYYIYTYIYNFWQLIILCYGYVNTTVYSITIHKYMYVICIITCSSPSYVQRLYIDIYIYIHTHIHIDIYIYWYIDILIHKHTHTHTHSHTHTQINGLTFVAPARMCWLPSCDAEGACRIIYLFLYLFVLVYLKI